MKPPKTTSVSMVFLNLVAAPRSCCSVKAARLSMTNARTAQTLAVPALRVAADFLAKNTS
jgi:hypothetical protein